MGMILLNFMKIISEYKNTWMSNGQTTVCVVVLLDLTIISLMLEYESHRASGGR